VAQAQYGERIATLEPYSIEHIPLAERHGRSGQLFWLWLAANLTIADYAIGFLPVALGLPLAPAIVALALGNILGGALLAWSAAMGPSAGYPQMFIGRRAFGRVGGYLPAALNWVSTVGWFTVNTILGSFALQLLIGGLPFWVAALLLVAVQTLLVVYGHNLIQAFERWMAGVLAVLFAIATVLALTHTSTITAWSPRPAVNQLALFAVVLAASFSYIMSWSPYASDYSRYLPERTSRRAVAWAAFAGAALASFWVELVGVMIAILAPGTANSVAALKQAMGWFGAIAVIAVILGATTANALNLYSNTISARVLDVRLPRWNLALVGAAIGFVLAVIAGARSFTTNYINFLLLLDYWIMPWLAIVLLDYYWLRQRAPSAFAGARPWNIRGGLAYVVGVLASVPFMVPVAGFYQGPLAAWFGGADFSYFVGFLVAGLVYLALNWSDRSAAELAEIAATGIERKA
jgi:nucleobase:cation symporter-1, NCS1 family